MASQIFHGGFKGVKYLRLSDGDLHGKTSGARRGRGFFKKKKKGLGGRGKTKQTKRTAAKKTKKEVDSTTASEGQQRESARNDDGGTRAAASKEGREIKHRHLEDLLVRNRKRRGRGGGGGLLEDREKNLRVQTQVSIGGGGLGWRASERAREGERERRWSPDRSCLMRPLLLDVLTGRKSLNQVISGSGFPLAAQSMVAVRDRSTTFS